MPIGREERCALARRPWQAPQPDLRRRALGLANGAYAVAAIGSMMGLASSGREAREGVRMGLWGAAQALAFGLGGFIGTLGSDLARHVVGAPGAAYAIVFAAEAALFVVSAALAARVTRPAVERADARLSPPGYAAAASQG